MASLAYSTPMANQTERDGMAHGALLPRRHPVLVAHLSCLRHLLELVAGSLCCGAATGAALDGGGCRAASLRSKSAIAVVVSASSSESLSTRYVSTPVAALSAAVAGPPTSRAPARASMVASMAWSVDDGGGAGGGAGLVLPVISKPLQTVDPTQILRQVAREVIFFRSAPLHFPARRVVG